MHEQLLIFPLLLYGADGVQVINNALLAPDTSHFILGLAVMRLLFHMALLWLFSDRHFRGYSLFGIAVCSVYILSHGPYGKNALSPLIISFVPLVLTYYVGTLYGVSQHFRKLVLVGWVIAIVCVTHLIASLFFAHPYPSQTFIFFLATLLMGLIALMLIGYRRGIRPSIWYLIPALTYVPLYAFYYVRGVFLSGQAVGVISSPLQETSLRSVFVLEFLFVPFLTALLLRETYQGRGDERRTMADQEQEKKQTLSLEQLKNRFFTNISHEFQTPLTLLLGPLEELQQRFPTDPTYSMMHRNAQRLHTLVHQLLDLAKIDAGQLKPDLQWGSVTDAVQTWVTAFEPLALNRGIDLTLDQSESDWQALYDADKVEKIATNLITNALKFTNRGGKVEVEAIYEAAGLTLRISDTGVGIPPENMPTIFDRFYQAETPKKNKPVAAMYEGSGVGLALVRELINLLEGSIGVASLVGEGTTFTVWIPMEGRSIENPKTHSEPDTHYDRAYTPPERPAK